jgi:hypothetical protein
MPGHLFICGCPRSGTTFLATLLNAHPAVAVGIERYGNRFFTEPLLPALFEEERFFDLQPGDTFYDDLSFSRVYADKRDGFARARLVGDKIPLLFRYLDRLHASFPEAKVVFCLRNLLDVAASYQARADNDADLTWHRDKGALAALEDWNEALMAYHRHRRRMNIHLFDYDRFAADGEAQMQELASWAGLNWLPVLERRTRRMGERARELAAARTRSLDGATVQRLLLDGAIGPYRRAIGKEG